MWLHLDQVQEQARLNWGEGLVPLTPERGDEGDEKGVWGYFLERGTYSFPWFEWWCLYTCVKI